MYLHRHIKILQSFLSFYFKINIFMSETQNKNYVIVYYRLIIEFLWIFMGYLKTTMKKIIKTIKISKNFFLANVLVFYAKQYKTNFFNDIMTFSVSEKIRVNTSVWKVQLRLGNTLNKMSMSLIFAFLTRFYKLVLF